MAGQSTFMTQLVSAVQSFTHHIEWFSVATKSGDSGQLDTPDA